MSNGGFFGLFGGNAKEEVVEESSDTSMKKYLSSLEPPSEKFKRNETVWHSIEEGGGYSEGEEYLDKKSVLMHYFVGDEVSTQKRNKNDVGQKWDTDADAWVDVSDDYSSIQRELRKTDPDKADPWISGGKKNVALMKGDARKFTDAWDQYTDNALSISDDYLGGTFRDVESKLMIEQLNYSKNPDDIVIKKPEVGKLRITNVRRPRNKQGKHLGGEPLIYTLDDGSEWTKPKSSYGSTRWSERSEGDVQYYKAIYNPRGMKMAGGDLSSVGWIPYKNTDDKAFDAMQKVTNGW